MKDQLTKNLKRLHQRLQDGVLLTGINCAFNHPGIFEVACNAGHDFVGVDAEHAAINLETMENLIRAADCHGVPCLVKLKEGTEVEIRNALDAGASGVMVPHVLSGEGLSAAVDATYFAPRGRRGVCSAARVNAHSSWDIRDLISWTNELVLLIPIIEDKEAVENIDEILAVDDRIQLYEIGPVDLALSLGLDLDRSITNPSPELVEALDLVTRKLREAGKKLLYPTRYPNSPLSVEEQREALAKRGVAAVYGMDTHCLVNAFRGFRALSGS